LATRARHPEACQEDNNKHGHVVKPLCQPCHHLG
jgi:hypothetical protein